MVTLTHIKDKIQRLNNTRFQEMCDEILFRTQRKIKSFSRSGMALEVDETKAGTPDSYFLLKNNKYVFNEHTKDKKRGFSKLKSDFESCIDENKLDATVDDIQAINFCISFRISKQDTLALNSLCNDKDIILGLWDIDRLSRNILYENPDLGNQYLGIPLDKSQWVLLKSFVINYNKAGKSIAAPLDNPFYFRDKEIEQSLSSIEEHHLTILSGRPGIGKSKIAVELLQRIKSEDPAVVVWVNSFDSSSIIEDLASKISNEDKIVLFIDDAHRVSHFQQILKYLRHSSYENIKLIVTVRDYALSDFGQLVYEYDQNIININRLNNGQVTEIIKADPFNVMDQGIQQKILDLGQGNLRLILMLAGLQDISKSIGVLNDTAEAFDFYFNTLLEDAPFLRNQGIIKTMAVLSFFSSINLKNDNFIESMTNVFGISKDDFNQFINDLIRLELVSFHSEEVKVAEQNLGFYFFNKAFFKDNVLSFETLLNHFYPKYHSRFKDCVISANNNFGHTNVVEKIKPALLSFLISKRLPTAELIRFYQLFWFAIPENTLAFIVEHSLSGELEKEGGYDFKYETNDFAYETDPMLELVVCFIRDPTIYFTDAILASLEYVKRNRNRASELLHTLKEYISFGYSDWQSEYFKQRRTLEILLNGFKENKKLEKELFYELSKTFLKHSFRKAEPTYNDNTISLYTFSQQINTFIEQFRKDIWATAYDNFGEYPELTLSLLNSCASQHPDNNEDLMLFDVPFILRLIKEKLDPEGFKDCKYVHKQIWWFRRSNIDRREFDNLLNRFNCPQFEFYRALDFEYLFGIQRYENDLYNNHSKYAIAKIEEIESYLESNYVNKLAQFYTDYSDILFATDHKWSLRDQSFDIAVTYFFKKDEKYIQALLNLIIEDDNKINYSPYRSFKAVLGGPNISLLIYQTINQADYHGRTGWVLQFFELLTSQKVQKKLARNIMDWAHSINDHFSISFEALEPYLEYETKLFQKIIPILNLKLKEGMRIYMFGDFTSLLIDSMKDNFDILKEMYFLQDLSDTLFDIQGKAFLKMCEVDPSFLKNYFEYYYNITELKRPSRDGRDRFNLIWSNDELISRMSDVLDYIIEEEINFGISDHAAGNLFKNLDPVNKTKALGFLRSYFLKNTNNTQRLNVVMDIIHKNFPDQPSMFIKIHLIKNKNLAIFKKVRWIISQGIWSGDVIPELVRASRWESVLQTVNGLKDDIYLIPIKNFIIEEIERQKEYATYSRKWHR